MTAETPGRLLRLLSLLQARRVWSGAELAGRLGVTGRTVRRDVGRLRALGYPVEATTGTAGGYRLASGRDLPPLLLDDEEAVAVAAGLLTAATARGMEETAARALAKLGQVLPARLRGRVAALGEATVPVAAGTAPRVDPATLAVVGAAHRDHEVLAFAYADRTGRASRRRVEPHGLVTVSGRWVMVAWDAGREDWRTFRLERMSDVAGVRHRFTPRPLPDADAAAYLARTLAAAPYRFRARVVITAGADEVRARLPGPVPGEITETGDGCLVDLRGDDGDLLAAHLAALGPDVRIEATPELRAHLRTVADRLRAMADAADVGGS